MGKRIITNNIDKWEIFSTITDSIETTFQTEEDLKKFLANEQIYNGKLKAVETLMSFPYKYSINQEIFCGENKDGMEKYYNWLKSVLYEAGTYEEYYSIIDKKLEELIA